PGGYKTLSLRSNIPEISKYTFQYVDPSFVERAIKYKGGFIVGGDNYGQGSSREHAALAVKCLGIKAIIAKSFARIHYANLINFGVVPLTFTNGQDYSRFSQGDVLVVNIRYQRKELKIKNATTGVETRVTLNLSNHEMNVIKAGGKLPFIKRKRKRR
ncbi:MAG: aconitate hydratase, partial [Candidatus Bathycorpusculaceae bacterium]